MARRSGFLAALGQVARESARQQRIAEATRQRQAREQLRYQREQLRLSAQLDKVERQQYALDRAAEAEEKSGEVEDLVCALRTILEDTLEVDDTLDFSSLRTTEKTVPFAPPPELLEGKSLPKREDFMLRVRPVTFLERFLSRHQRYELELREAESRFDEATRQRIAAEEERKATIARLAIEHEQKNAKRLAGIRQRNSEVDALIRAYDSGESSAVRTYCSMVLERSSYPEGFPQRFRLAYDPECKQLVIDYELPALSVIPPVAEYRYMKTKDSIEEKPRKTAEVKEIYQDVIAAVTLRTIHEVFEADQGGHLSIVVFNGFVQAVDPSTGKDITPYLISVRATKENFEEIDLARIDKRACLRNLGAQVSPQAADLRPVKPLIEFDMVDRRFVEGTDVLADLESRPNLMDLTPFEFEQLVGNLFSKMGLDSKQTRSSRDGGVDVVAFDTRPLVGGKVVIQAKRYRNTVGVSAVRDLFGTMSHEGANKGILVATSHYGVDAYEFIKGKPIELIDGSGLLYYLEEKAGIKACIIFPEDDA
ncbi:restriction endonuclease [Paludibaculum fermentans]|uniref:Restriction endonuclease n=1 Tax=Paludibaculum fermentans TaxID=1473598 RepID=A0A7S7SMH3_PALFE|nr:restriction endonuclease [Paludibaculum fermentans]QOY91282.1 restriction endonuclease [Paludibaculum fermentans]